MEIKVTPKRDYQKVHRFKKKWTGARSYGYEKKKWSKRPSLVIACYDKQKLIGICTGFKRKGFIILGSIAVEGKYQRKGIGSKMLRFFEKEARKLGERTLSVASAEGYVERFYLMNKFKPSSLLVRIRRNKVPKNYNERGFDIVKERGNQHVKILYIDITKKYNPKLKNIIKRKYNAYEVLYILEKKL